MRDDSITVFIDRNHHSSRVGQVVPYRLAALVTGAGCMVLSYKFRPTDCNLNMMPLFHVGGDKTDLVPFEINRSFWVSGAFMDS